MTIFESARKLFLEKDNDDSPIEIITGQELVENLQTLIDSRRILKMEIPETRFSWITMILGMQQQDNSDFLLVDPVAPFESILSRFPTQEVSFEFLENGILCKFSTRVIRCQSRAIWLEFPKSMQRIQRRAYFRIEASPGAVEGMTRNELGCHIFKEERILIQRFGKI